MKVLSLLLAVVCLAYTFADDESGKELDKEATELTEGIFKWEVGQAQASQDTDKASEGSDDKQGKNRRRRSVDSLAVFNPGYRYSRGYYHEEPARGAVFEVFSPGVRRTYSTGEVSTAQTSFARFFESFRPLRAVRTEDDVFVRSYVRFSAPDECMDDFQKLSLTQIRTITSDAYGGYSALGDAAWKGSQEYVAGVQRDKIYTAASAGRYGLLGGLRLGGSRGYASVVTREGAVGYVGYLRDFPYQVSVLQSGCRLEEFPGYHNCIVFSGTTYPYTRSVRKFVYVDRQKAAAIAGFSKGGWSHSDLF